MDMFIPGYTITQPGNMKWMRHVMMAMLKYKADSSHIFSDDSTYLDLANDNALLCRYQMKIGQFTLAISDSDVWARQIQYLSNFHFCL